MRDPQRIKVILSLLEKAWERVPDERFGQLMINILSEACGETKLDPFFIEDDVMINFIRDYAKPAQDENNTPQDLGKE